MNAFAPINHDLIDVQAHKCKTLCLNNYIIRAHAMSSLKLDVAYQSSMVLRQHIMLVT